MNPYHFGRAGLRLILTALLVLPVLRFAEPALGASDLPAMIVLVRHAEKADKPAGDPPLTSEGSKRAEQLAAVLTGADLTAVITTQLLRTRETAQPAATARGLPIESIKIDPDQQDAHVKAVLAALRKRAGGSVLVVGHSTTVPKLIEALAGAHMPEICESVYDRLFVLVPTSAKPLLVQSRYGAPSSEKGCK
jgi:phosphohistidine phosphatase SixA